MQPLEDFVKALLGGDFPQLLIPYEMKLTRGLAQDGIKFIKRNVRVGILQDIMDQAAGGPDQLAVDRHRGKPGKIQDDEGIAEIKKQGLVARHDIIYYQPLASFRQAFLCFSRADIFSILSSKIPNYQERHG